LAQAFGSSFTKSCLRHLLRRAHISNLLFLIYPFEFITTFPHVERCPMAFVWWAFTASILACPVVAQIRILEPRELVRDFPNTHGVIYGTTATFGTPYYGERVVGRLMHSLSKKGKEHCAEDDYDLVSLPILPPVGGGLAIDRGHLRGQELLNVVLVNRGLCTFVTKVRVAERKGAHAVVVVDQMTSDRTSEDIQRIIMADDGYGDDVRIPSMLISRFEGRKLIDAVLGPSPVIVELAWDIPRAEVVLVDLWMSSASRESSIFLARFKYCAETLKYRLQFVPHYHVFRLGSGADGGGGNRLCSDPAGRHCAPDPDGPGPVTGADVADEDARQLCIWNVTARRDPSRFHGATYSQEFWEYVARLPQECALEGGDPASRFGERCSSKLMERLRIPVQKVAACIARDKDRLLDGEAVNVAWSPLALRLNGWRYSGPLDPQTVLKAVCSGYSRRPPECKELLDAYAGFAPLAAYTITLDSFLVLMVLLVFGMAACFLFYKRRITKSVRSVLREEAMLEVQHQMTEYALLQDGGKAAGAA